MDRIKIMAIFGLIVFGSFLWLLPSIGLSQCNVSVGVTPYSSIQAAINSVSSYATISVTGTCYENLFISELKNYITLTVPTRQTAEIIGTIPNRPTITIKGKEITVEKFTIGGAYDGIQVLGGGTAKIEDNMIENTGGIGIVVAWNSYAQICGNTIQDNPREGIGVSDNSYARIGIRSYGDTTPIPNTIQRNANGVTVGRSSSAVIIGNTISSNTNDGVTVFRVSQADTSSNTIDDNGRNGIFVTQNSGVNLGRDTGGTIFALPNSSIVGNGAYGLSCAIGGYADGRLGTLKGLGKHDATDFTKDCIDHLNP